MRLQDDGKCYVLLWYTYGKRIYPSSKSPLTLFKSNTRNIQIGSFDPSRNDENPRTMIAWPQSEPRMPTSPFRSTIMIHLWYKKTQRMVQFRVEFNFESWIPPPAKNPRVPLASSKFFPIGETSWGTSHVRGSEGFKIPKPKAKSQESNE